MYTPREIFLIQILILRSLQLHVQNILYLLLNQYCFYYEKSAIRVLIKHSLCVIIIRCRSHINLNIQKFEEQKYRL